MTTIGELYEKEWLEFKDFEWRQRMGREDRDMEDERMFDSIDYKRDNGILLTREEYEFDMAGESEVDILHAMVEDLQDRVQFLENKLERLK
jgi:hypothetical protein